MTLNDVRRNCAGRIAGGVLALTMLAVLSGAQETATPNAVPVMSRTERSDRMQTAPTEMFYLKNGSSVNDGNEILTGLRLILDPGVKLYLVPSENAILIRALPDDLALAKKLIDEMDRPRKNYRLTYTISEMDGTKRLGTQHFVMEMQEGKRLTLKTGSKVPVATGKFDGTNNSSETQMTYLDVGYNFDSTLTESGSGAQLKTKVERSSVSAQRPAAAPQDPTIQQAVLEGTLMLPTGKAEQVGSLDVPDSTRHLEIEAMLEVVQ